MNRGWALFTPSGKIIGETFARTKGEAEGHAYAYLSGRPWTEGFWKQWQPFVRQRERRGWIVRPVRLVPARRR